MTHPEQSQWKLVPVEPTPEMWDAAWRSIGLPYRAKLSMHEIKTLFSLFHAAMLAAAPEQNQAQPAEQEGFTLEQLADACAEVGVSDSKFEALVIAMKALAATPAPAPASGFAKALDIRASQGWELTGNAIPVLYTDTINGDQVMRDDVWLCTTAALKSEAPAPAQEPPQGKNWHAHHAIVNKAALQMVRNALKNDVERGLNVRGEMLDELDKATFAVPVPAQEPVTVTDEALEHIVKAVFDAGWSACRASELVGDNAKEFAWDMSGDEITDRTSRVISAALRAKESK